MLEGLLFFLGICVIFALIPLLIAFAAVKATKAENAPRNGGKLHDGGIRISATMGRLIGIVALLGLCISLAVHISALMGIDVNHAYPSIWWLHVGVFAVFIPFSQSLKQQLGPNHRLSDYFTILPVWATALEIALIVYAITNFALFFAGTQGGHPDFQEGKYVLKNAGKVMRELTQHEYHALGANELRGFSGHWMLFYFAPFAYFLFGKKSNIAQQETPASGCP